jgi:hypothetical protein
MTITEEIKTMVMDREQQVVPYVPPRSSPSRSLPCKMARAEQETTRAVSESHAEYDPLHSEYDDVAVHDGKDGEFVADRFDAHHRPNNTRKSKAVASDRNLKLDPNIDHYGLPVFVCQLVSHNQLLMDDPAIARGILGGKIEHVKLQLLSPETRKRQFDYFRHYFIQKAKSRDSNLRDGGGLSYSQILRLKEIENVSGVDSEHARSTLAAFRTENQKRVIEVMASIIEDIRLSQVCAVSNYEFSRSDVELRMAPPGLERPPFGVHIHGWTDEINHPVTGAPFPYIFPDAKYVIGTVSLRLATCATVLDAAVTKLLQVERLKRSAD